MADEFADSQGRTAPPDEADAAAAGSPDGETTTGAELKDRGVQNSHGMRSLRNNFVPLRSLISMCAVAKSSAAAQPTGRCVGRRTRQAPSGRPSKPRRPRDTPRSHVHRHDAPLATRPPNAAETVRLAGGILS